MPETAEIVAPEARARSIAEQVFERQYREGLKTIQSNEWASDIYTLILNECPHLPEEEVVRLFRNKHGSEAEMVLGEALFREYNVTHSRRSR